MKDIAVRALIISMILISCFCQPILIASAQEDGSSIAIKVDIKTDGSATWTLEKKIPLNDPEDVAAWDENAAIGTDKFKADFELRMRDYVGKISSSIGRPMLVKDVRASVEKTQPYAIIGNYSVTYGILKYEFTWTNFARVNDDVIEVGDVFVDGFLLSHEDSIRFICPAGYNVTDIRPSSDELKEMYQPQVIWYGSSVNNTNPDVRIFSSGEPGITLSKAVASSAWNIDWLIIAAVAIFCGIAGFGASYLLVRKKEKPMVAEMPESDEKPFEIEEDEEEAEIPPVVSDTGSDDRFMSDEEKIIKYLEEEGGQMFQSDLVKKTSFSKSKLSMVLSDLKDKGVIIKIKKGKENLIRLNKATQAAPKEDNKGEEQP